MRIALIDHYDSFSYNLFDWLVGEDGAWLNVSFVPFDRASEISNLEAEDLALVISPGPKEPYSAPQTLRLIERNLGRVPIFGVCLGHQFLAAHAGARIQRAKVPFHGRKSLIATKPEGLFTGMPQKFYAASYNSLTVAPEDLKAPWRILGWSESGEVQAIAREVAEEEPAFGVQFHPESFMSEHSDIIRRNWLNYVKRFEEKKKADSSAKTKQIDMDAGRLKFQNVPAFLVHA